MPDKSGKPNIFQRWAQRFRKIIQETVGELRKVSWPTRQEAWNLTLVVLVVITIMTIILGTLDLLYAQFFKLLLGA